jgi:hypothetical protein
LEFRRAGALAPNGPHIPPIRLENADLVLKLVCHPHAAQGVQFHAHYPPEGGGPLVSCTAAEPHLFYQTPRGFSSPDAGRPVSNDDAVFVVTGAPALAAPKQRHCRNKACDAEGRHQVWHTQWDWEVKGSGDRSISPATAVLMLRSVVCIL